MFYSNIKFNDIANGTGVRTTLFVSGCRRHCRGCFNPETWSFSNGKPFTSETIESIIDSLKPDHIAGLTILGGEPFELENIPDLIVLTDIVRDIYPTKPIWCYSGFAYEELIANEVRRRFLENIDVLVDGEFLEEAKDPSLAFRGSNNQRIINVAESLRLGNVSTLNLDRERL